VPVAALVDEKLHRGQNDGFRIIGMPRDGDAWHLGIEALNAEAKAAHGAEFADLPTGFQNTLLTQMQRGELNAAAWRKMRPELFFTKRMAHDIVLAYYAHPTAWSEIGWGGPASPRGYVRLDYNDRDPWEAAEAQQDGDMSAWRKNRRV
jgi:hypothetical protein